MSDPEWVQDLPALLAEVWRRLEAGEGAARHPALASAGPDGPEVRTVVLRGADRTAATLDFHSDAVSPKVVHFRRHPRAAILIWDAEAALQTRLHARVSVRAGESAAATWSNVPANARVRYGGTVPGTPLSAPERAEDTADLERFAVLRAYVHRIDVLHLGRHHRRGLYLSDDGFAGRWIAP